jgi:hypothetical protein
MTGIFSPRVLLVAVLFIMLGLSASPNLELWFACLLLLPAIVWILGGNQAYPVLVWVIGLNWLSIAADVLRADLSGQSATEGWLGRYDEQAILISLCALLAIAFGMRWGVRFGGSRFRARLYALSSKARAGARVALGRLLICYAGSLVVSQAMGLLAASIPTLAQPFLAFALLKYVVVYAIAASVFDSDRGYSWLLLVIGAEFVVGMAGYFANFTEPVFLLVIAMASSRHGLTRASTWVIGVASVAALLWVSIVWTAIKFEYRSEMSGKSLQERVTWLTDRYLSPKIDYGDAATRLLDRVSYTELFARVLAYLDAGEIGNDFNFYRAAVKHVLTPRVLFPDKAALDDSQITTALTGERIDENTSIGVGYIAEAQVDFGFPGLLLPMLAIGFMLGLATEYFMTRPVPVFVRQAFATATSFHVFFFEEDIDKGLGFFITAWLAMALVLKFGYPLVATWLTCASRINIVSGKRRLAA